MVPSVNRSTNRLLRSWRFPTRFTGGVGMMHALRRLPWSLLVSGDWMAISRIPRPSTRLPREKASYVETGMVVV